MTRLGIKNAVHTASGVDCLGPLDVDFYRLKGFLEQTYKVQLPDPLFSSSTSLSVVKEFCGGLLDNPEGHLWGPATRCLSVTRRTSISGSLFLFRKVLPSKKVDPNEWIAKMIVQADRPSKKYESFVVNTILKLFPKGWDKSYERRVNDCSLSSSSCIGSKRSEGGARGLSLRGEFSERQHFCQVGIGLDTQEIPLYREVQVVATEGKDRVITRSPPEMQYLKPLHDTLYSFISRYDWLLRGEALPCKFKGFTQVDGEVFVSGDYESATDNLSLEVAELVLTTVLGRATHIPLSIKKEAVASLRGLLLYGREYDQQRGQLMGSLLSFPLLCLQNYCSFRFLTGPDLPVRINGDDIVFRSTPSIAQQWMDGVKSTGLTLSRGKTIVNSHFFSLNSTFFRTRRDKVSLIPVLRSTCLREKRDPAAFSGSYSKLRSEWNVHDRDKVLEYFVKKHYNLIKCTQRSLRRGLGLRVSDAVLKSVGLWSWEGFYSALPNEKPLPADMPTWFQNCIPVGWVRVPVEKKVDTDPRFVQEMINLTWTQSPKNRTKTSTDEYWRNLRLGTYSCAKWVKEWNNLGRRARILKLSRRRTREYLAITIHERKRIRYMTWKYCPSDPR